MRLTTGTLAFAVWAESDDYFKQTKEFKDAIAQVQYCTSMYACCVTICIGSAAAHALLNTAHTLWSTTCFRFHMVHQGVQAATAAGAGAGSGAGAGATAGR